MSREEPQNQISKVMPTEEPQDQAGKVMPKDEPATGKKGLVRRFSFKKNKKGKEDKKIIIPAMPVIEEEEVASPSIVGVETIARVEPTPDVEATNKADGKVSRFELVLAFYNS
jgi:hypothetical protein